MQYHKHINLLATNGFSRIPLILNSAGHLSIAVRINGVDALMTVDTGASATCLDDSRVFHFGVSPQISEDRATGLGVYGESTQAATVDSIEIGELLLRRKTIVILNLDHINHAYSEQKIPLIDGVIGSDLLKEMYGIIDYPNLLLFLAKPD